MRTAKHKRGPATAGQKRWNTWGHNESTHGAPSGNTVRRTVSIPDFEITVAPGKTIPVRLH